MIILHIIEETIIIAHVSRSLGRRKWSHAAWGVPASVAVHSANNGDSIPAKIRETDSVSLFASRS